MKKKIPLIIPKDANVLIFYVKGIRTAHDLKIVQERIDNEMEHIRDSIKTNPKELHNLIVPVEHIEKIEALYLTPDVKIEVKPVVKDEPPHEYN